MLVYDGLWLGVVGEDVLEGEEGAKADVGDKDCFCGLGL